MVRGVDLYVNSPFRQLVIAKRKSKAFDRMKMGYARDLAWLLPLDTRCLWRLILTPSEEELFSLGLKEDCW